MSVFDTVIVVDWSAKSAPSPVRPSADAIWIAETSGGETACSYHRTRSEAVAHLEARFEGVLAEGRRVLAGFDFAFGYPAGTAQALTGHEDVFALWAWLAERIEDDARNGNNRFEVAAEMNRCLQGRPFWGRPKERQVADLHWGKGETDYSAFAERRAVEQVLTGAKPVWQLMGNGSVGSQSLTGLPRLQGLRVRFGGALSVWPFEAPETPIVLAEVWPSMLADEVAAQMGPDDVKDAAQVTVLAEALHAAAQRGDMGALLAAAKGPEAEGWVLGASVEHLLRRRTTLSPPPLSNDCFALPPGVDWTPVDEALDVLRARLGPVVGSEILVSSEADGRVVAQDVVAVRANPPGANSAVDGYGFAHASLFEGDNILPLVAGRAAAGAPFEGSVPEGHAVRILTGALVPEGVDTVVLEEDTRTDATHVAFRGPVKRGANTRRAGEDVEAGEVILREGHILRPPDLALLAATGNAKVEVRHRLRVGVLSTGDELAAPGSTMDPARTFDANRPMLLSLIRRWGYEAVDLGHVPDDRDTLRDRLDGAGVQAILTSGGASAGDEDHVSALLRDEGNLTSWRIALKPGRPLALALWKGVPVIGLPGNPVAALVCAALFARPSLSMLAGAGWPEPPRFKVPAAFEKRKKPGRREYLRARLGPDGVEVFKSEGSGRISGLSWADGLVELPDGAANIARGDLVTFLPYADLGIG
ncbi:gephyrin-like molybdotransferase Glp [Palleronia caenipelagi]|uniref:Molybdopterin molybdenumtransferase n=1 Tax=Palleronia caenipelagi TaxID=2489174 RepID=A0A547Q2T9_9RHOB|nr:gephyrin-like molybdotransferase Glp [Palleronia caenipelagi]TRD20715.1 molybdopterin molybdenumtransferase MoeA [Palleronia caenipelagi]